MSFLALTPTKSPICSKSLTDRDEQNCIIHDCDPEQSEQKYLDPQISSVPFQSICITPVTKRRSFENGGSSEHIRDLSTTMGLTDIKSSGLSPALTIQHSEKTKFNFQINPIKLSCVRKLRFDEENNPDSLQGNTKEILQENINSDPQICEENKEDKGQIELSVKQESISRQNSIKSRKDQCRYCQELDNIENLIRPCLCKGSIQYTHQECLQKTIENNYMDEHRVSFVRKLECDICKFQFLIKTYNTYDFRQLSQDAQASKAFKLYVSILVLLLGLIASLLAVTFCNSVAFRKELALVIFIVLVCVICFFFSLMIVYNITQMLENFVWKVLDRADCEPGHVVNQETLSNLVQYFRNKKKRVSPQKN